MKNVTITENTTTRYGGGLYIIAEASPLCDNLIVWGNSANVNYDQIYAEPGSNPVLSYSCVADGWTGTGNISSNPLFATGPEGGFYLSQTAAGQTSNSPCVDAGDPFSSLLQGTTRTDLIADAGIMDMGYHYPAGTVTAPDLWINVSPTGSTTIPSSGGTLPWNIEIGNAGEIQGIADIWVDLTLPSGSTFGPILGPVQDFTIASNWSADRDRTLTVPANAPTGSYTLNGYIGDFDLNLIIDEDHFTWTKSGAVVNGLDVWFSDSGEDFNAQDAEDQVPTSEMLLSTYPNPFNPTTTISYSLPNAAHVTLELFDIGGRSVKQIAAGYRTAGVHQVNLEASNLPSGLYFLQLSTPNSHTTQKVVITK